MTVPFISTGDLGFYTGQDLSTSDLAVMVCDAACQLIRDEIDQFINYVEDDVIYLDGRNRSMLILPEQPIVAVSEILIDDDAADELIEGTDFRIVNERSMLERLSSGSPDDEVVWDDDNQYKITYSHGWAATEGDVDEAEGIFRVPSSIRMIALALGATGMVSGTVGVGGVQSETLGRYKYTLADTGTDGGGSMGMVISEIQCEALRKYAVEGVA